MSSIFRSILKAVFTTEKFPAKEKSVYYNGGFNAAPYYWALIPLRTGLDGQRAKREEIVFQNINKNKQL